MPFLNKLDFVENSLSVSYRGSVEPQTLDIVADVPWPLDDMFGDMGPLHVLHFILHVNRGLCGGSEFAPTDGKAELLEGPKPKRAAPDAPDYHWVVRLAGVTPRALRPFIERFRMSAGRRTELQGLTLRGSLPLDTSRLSVREGTVAAWLENSSTYPEQWEPVPFEIVGREGKKSAIIKCTIAGATSPKLLEELNDALLDWLIACSWYPDRSLTKKGTMDGIKMGRTDTQLTANIAGWDYASEPMQDALINMLVRFHHDVVAIRRLELTFPP